MVGLAQTKLSCGDISTDKAQTAALSVRVMLDFDIARESSRTYEEKLVESYMRVAFAVPEHREFLRSGTPSEPLLAEAAAQLLSVNNWIQDGAPDLLFNLMEGGFLARGERGEMIGRLLWTIAHDNVICRLNLVDKTKLQFHRPILLLDWLKELINPQWHESVLSSKPIADPHGLSLEEAFKDAYLNFSHFARAEDDSVLSPDMLYLCLVRHMAYQCADNQRSTDIVAAVHHEGLEAPIGPENTSPLYGQMKDRAKFSEVLLNPHIGGTPRNGRPILSLVHDLGIGIAKVYPHRSAPAKELRLLLDDRTENIHLQHYQIHIEGCTHETYGIVPAHKNHVYTSILEATKVIDDFPRNDIPEHRHAMLRLKPSFKDKFSFGWVHGSSPPLSSASASVATKDVKRKGGDQGGRAKKLKCANTR